MEQQILEELKKMNKNLEKQNELLERMNDLFEKYDAEYLEEVEKDGIVKQE